MSSDSEEQAPPAETPMPWQKFLDECPPGKQRPVTGIGIGRTKPFNGLHAPPPPDFFLARPALNLFCPSEPCNRKQFFACTSTESRLGPSRYFLTYQCRNCGRTSKTFALRIDAERDTSGRALKLGEEPQFGPPLPARLQRLIQPHRDLFLKGFQSENRGLGIGAFAYYRRVVENEKDRLIGEIIKVCGKVTGGTALIPVLENARKQTQFTSAVEDIAEAIPDALRISGHNPLTLLHSALSKGLHNKSDEECLVAAHAIRVVLTEMANRMSEILKETAELHQAVAKLMGAPVTTPPPPPTRTRRPSRR